MQANVGTEDQSVDDLVRRIGELRLDELKHFTEQFEQTYGVRYVHAPEDAPSGHEVPSSAGTGVDEKDEFDLILEAAGNNRIQVIKVVRELTGLGLGEAKALVEAAPSKLPDALPGGEAKRAISKLEDAGATVELVPAPESDGP